MPRDLRSRLVKRALKAGIFLDEALATQLLAFYELLSRWNRKINLTALENPDEAIDRLLLEPVAAAKAIGPQGPKTLIDIGSGGGSPAIPLALALGGAATLTMVEVKARKSAFLREAVRHLELKGASVENIRYEELLAKPDVMERFDCLSIRAVRVEPRVLMTLQAFVRPGGQLLLFRGASSSVAPENVIHPLEFEATVPLVDSLQSRLTVLRKRPQTGRVPRGTLVTDRPRG